MTKHKQGDKEQQQGDDPAQAEANPSPRTLAKYRTVGTRPQKTTRMANGTSFQRVTL